MQKNFPTVKRYKKPTKAQAYKQQVAQRRMQQIMSNRVIPMQLSNNNKGEIKTVDIAQTVNSFRTIAAVSGILLNGCTAGASYYNRIGAKIRMKSIQFKANVTNAATAIEGILRWLIVYDKQTNGVMPAITDILETRDFSGTATTTIYSCLKTENRERFEIVRDKTWHSPSVTNTGGVLTNLSFPSDDDEMEFSEFLKLKSRKTCYKASTGAVGDITTGGLYMFCLISGAADQSWSITTATRLRFYDN